jgi:hypothetical protein
MYYYDSIDASKKIGLIYSTWKEKIALQQKSFYPRQKMVFSNQLSITWEANSINTGNEFAFLRKHSEFI